MARFHDFKDFGRKLCGWLKFFFQDWALKSYSHAQVASGSHALQAELAPRANIVGQDMWTEAHEKEKKFQDAKRLQQYFQSIREGATAWSSLSQEMQDAFYAFASHDDDLQRQALNKADKVHWSRPAINLGGLKVWFDENVVNMCAQHDLQRWSSRLGMTATESPLRANVQVWSEVSNPSWPYLIWHASIGGKRIMDVACLKSAMKVGSSLKYKAAIDTQRTVHVTQQFAQCHPRITEAILAHCNRFDRTSKWRYEEDLAKFLEAAAKSVRQKKPCAVMAFGEEHDRLTMSNVKLFLTATDLPKITVLDRHLTVTGQDASGEWSQLSKAGG